MATERVIIWGKEEAGFDNDKLGNAGHWALFHMEKCPEMQHLGIAYSILTRETEFNDAVGITKIVECRACHTKFILEQYFIDAKTGKWIPNEEEENE